MVNNDQQSPAAPIKDTNKDGVLSGRELADQLKAEDKNGPATRAANEAVHGVLETARIREIFAQYRGNNENIATMLNLALNGALQSYEAMGRPSGALLDETLHQNVQSTPATQRQPADILEADLKNYGAFLQTAKAMFPKGVSISAAEVPELIEQFSPSGGGTKVKNPPGKN